MFKKVFLVFLFSLAMLCSVAPVFAQDFGLQATAEKAQYGETTDIYSMIGTILRLGLSAMGIIFLAVMFYAGMRWMTARGNEEFATKAKEAMFAAMMGFFLVVAAYGLTLFVFSKLVK